LPKSPKKTVNPLPKPFGVLESASGAEWPLAAQVDPRKTEIPLSVFAVGNGDMGQLGMGTDETNELRRPKLHPWFEENSQMPTKEEKTVEQDTPAENGDASGEKKEATSTQTEPTLGKLGVEDVACGGMHSLVVDSNGKVCEMLLHYLQKGNIAY
jgi:regulator of chromosome condensation